MMSVYEELNDTQQFACRVIADHARSTAFSIADGILPGNEGRNYVLRKIMRRAIYNGREHLGLKDLFFYKVCDFVVGEMSGAYPELATQRDFIGKMVRLEEARFGTTVTVGLARLNDLDLNSETPKDDELFRSIGKLYDTFGTPRDLIRVFLEQKGIEFAEDDYNDRFDSALHELQQQSGVGQTARKSQISPVYAAMLEKVGANKFLGYEATQIDGARVVAILDGEDELGEIGEGTQGSIILDRTPFYAESGGQVGDSGRLTSANGSITVSDTYSPVQGLIIHKVTVNNGAVTVGDHLTATVDADKRDATRRNHTATHLVHAALREVLGTHVKQAGSIVAPNYLRFDFTHYQPMSPAEITEIEDLVNRYILKNEPVSTDVMNIEDAMRSGAVALFGEKYGSDVRVLSVGGGEFSRELCGGTHVRATGDIGSFKITADEAIASGVRRIRAITGIDAFERFRDDEALINASLGVLNTQRDNLPNAIARLQDDLKKTRKEMDELKLKIATGSLGGDAVGDEPREVSGVQVVGKIVEGLDANGTRQLSDTLLARLKSGVVVLGRKDEGKVGIIVRVSDDLTARVKAGDIIREIAPIVGGRGGGKADMAEGGGTDPDKLAEAIDAAYDVIARMAS
ncbi:MAG TPA: alanine--tRNA ligase [Pyrinomonadaceae bacterium]|nr:alanine--tRNA ligase [Pyrinomonadaceae bacterium]